MLFKMKQPIRPFISTLMQMKVVLRNPLPLILNLPNPHNIRYSPLWYTVDTAVSSAYSYLILGEWGGLISGGGGGALFIIRALQQE